MSKLDKELEAIMEAAMAQDVAEDELIVHPPFDPAEAMIYMVNNALNTLDCGEFEMTLAAEHYAQAKDAPTWLDDPDHDVWEVAAQVASFVDDALSFCETDDERSEAIAQLVSDLTAS